MNARAAACAALLSLAPAAFAAAQEPGVTPPPAVLPDTVPPSGYPWLLSYFPYIAGGVGGGPVAVARVRYFQPSPFQARSTYRADVTADLGIGFHGSRFARVQFRAPRPSEPFRAAILLDARRNTRESFFGIGNDREYDRDLADIQEFAYRVHRTEYKATGELTRRIIGGLHIAGAGGVRVNQYSELPGGSVFGGTIGSELDETDVVGRLSLVFDTRDNEFDPSEGVLIESGASKGSGNDGYSRVYGVARGYHRLGERTVVAARAAATQLYGDPTLSARLDLPVWEDEIGVYGGGGSNRALKGNRFVGSGALFGNFEVRREVLTTKNAASVTLVAFLDLGRVFEGEKLRLTTDGVHVGGGLGAALRILRTTTVIINGAQGPDGFRLDIASGWAF